MHPLGSGLHKGGGDATRKESNRMTLLQGMANDLVLDSALTVTTDQVVHDERNAQCLTRRRAEPAKWSLSNRLCHGSGGSQRRHN